MAVAPPDRSPGRGRVHRPRPTSETRSRMLAVQVAVALLIGAVGVLAPTPRLVTQAAMATETRRPAQEADDPTSSTTVRVADADETTTMSSPTTEPPDPTTADAPPTRRVVVDEDTRDFNLIGVTLPEAPDAPVLVRTAGADGVWAPWQPLTFDEADPPPPVPGAPVPDEPEEGNPGTHSDPLWVGDATRYELSLNGGDLPDAQVHLVYETTRQVAVVETAPADAALARPAIQSRSAWGARAPRVTPSIASSLQFAVVHHSGGTNSYTAAEVPALLRSIQAYHMDANGWNDIGYNFAVDRFGRIWEARAGVDRAVIGGHAAGFNTGSTGVVVLGNYETAGATAASVSAVGSILAWKFAIHGVDPRRPVAYRAGSGSPRYPPGTVVTINRIVGHSDVGRTACPGRNLYAQLGNIRSRAASGYVSAYALPPTEAGSLVLTSMDAGRLDVFGRTTAGSLAHRYRSAAGSWSGVRDLGGVSRSQPAAVSWGRGRLDVFVRGTDNALWHRWYQGGWSRWESLGGGLSSAPAAAAWASGRLDVFVRGTDNALWHRWYQGGWSRWERLGGAITSSPTAASQGPRSIDVMARGLNDTIYSRSFTSTGWSAWRSLGGVATSQPALTSPTSGRLDLVVRGTDAGFWHRWGVAGRGWSSWTSLGGRLASGPGATSIGDGITIGGRAPNSALYLRVRSSPDGGWGPWTRVP